MFVADSLGSLRPWSLASSVGVGCVCGGCGVFVIVMVALVMVTAEVVVW